MHRGHRCHLVRPGGQRPGSPAGCAGVSFCGRRGWAHGLLVTLAIGLHNIPEGLAVATVLVARGTTPRKALEWTLLCALPQPLFAVPSFIFVDSFRALLPASMGFAAGCMIWITIAELLPDALEDMPAGVQPLPLACHAYMPSPECVSPHSPHIPVSPHSLHMHVSPHGLHNPRATAADMLLLLA